MPFRLYSLKDVPEDEAQETRALLHDHHIEFYETPANKWGFSHAAIWIKDETHYLQARELLDRYQKQRCETMRQRYEEQRQLGTAVTWLHQLREQPVRFLFYVVVSMLVLYFSLMPFFRFAD